MACRGVMAVAFGVAALAWPAGAVAQEPGLCPGGSVATASAIPTRPARTASSEGLNLAPADGAALLLWTERTEARISAEVGLILTLADGRECRMALAQDKARAIRVPAVPRSRVVALEAGICFELDQMCLPIRLLVPGRR